MDEQSPPLLLRAAGKNGGNGDIGIVCRAPVSVSQDQRGFLCSAATGSSAFTAEGKIKSIVTATRWEKEDVGDDGTAGYWVGTGKRHFAF